MTNLLHRNHKFVTVRNRCSKIPLSTAMYPATHIWKSCVVHQSWCLCFFMWTAIFKIQPSSSCAFTFLLLFIQPNSKNLMLQGRGTDEECAPDSNSSKWITIQNYTFFSQKLILLPSKILTFPPESPCIRYHCKKFSCHSDLPPGIGVFLIMTVCEWKCKSTPSPEQQRQKQYPEDISRLQENQESVQEQP
jgi:hypothetical protein